MREATEQKADEKAKTEPALQKTSPASSTAGGEVEDRSWQAHQQAYRELGRELDSLFLVFSRLPGQSDNGFQPSVDQALFLLNSEQMVKFTTDFQLLDQLTTLAGKPDELSTQLYLSVLSRRPDDKEQQEVAKLLAGTENRDQLRQAIRRIIWGLLVSAEFRLNH